MTMKIALAIALAAAVAGGLAGAMVGLALGARSSGTAPTTTAVVHTSVEHRPGDRVMPEVTRHGAHRTVTVTPGNVPPRSH
jgi:S1-C subfamily serine protease